MRDELADHPDRLRWNARYDGRAAPSFGPHDLAVAALHGPLPDGPLLDGRVLDLACGLSGSALAAAAAGRRVTAVDISDVALRRLRAEAGRRGLLDRIELVHADLARWRPAGAPYALVLCAGYWDRAVFGWAAAALAAGGVLGWQALTQAARVARPGLPADWCLGPGEPATLLPPGFTVLSQADVPDAGAPGTWRRLLARRGSA
jgi:SAM-dependent methyltransferase